MYLMLNVLFFTLFWIVLENHIVNIVASLRLYLFIYLFQSQTDFHLFR